MTTRDIDGIITRIIGIIEKKNTDDSLGLRNIKYAEPDYNMYDDPPPYCFVKLARDFQSTRNDIGRSEGAEPQQLVYLEIGIIGFGKNITAAQKMQLPITDGIKSALYGNRTLKNPETDNDPLVSRLSISRTSRLESGPGQQIAGSLISVMVQIGNNSTISIGNIAELQEIGVLSAPVSRNTETNVPYYNAERKLKGYAPIGGVKTRFYEIEHTIPIETKLEELKESRTRFTLTQQIAGVTKSFTALIGNIGTGTRSFDSLATITVQFDIM